MEYIYSRVSTDKQDTENQLQSLRLKYPNAAIVTEVESGYKNKPKLNELIASLKKGDTLIVAALDRLGRRTKDLINLIESMHDRGVSIVSVREGLDYSTPVGKAMVQMLCIMAELERNFISLRTKQALAAKRAQGVRLGAPQKHTNEAIEHALALVKHGVTYRKAAKLSGVSVSRISELNKRRKYA